ncbi:cytochrome c biogenesis CcdA family protein [Rugamonas sp.]|uniref:cytochrome c biogenesis CcdA family protein n=1 Tax=Rugamonas sp. TaxID=1926287 RepID=UPI0025F42CBC|nr:cytochrome c biogenesis CcdA family protein [Rugamonas sp.]
MDFGPTSYGFGFAAGLLSPLSPCVLPIIPILLGTAANAHPRASLALAGGLAISYAVIGTTLASVGTVVGLDGEILKTGGAAILGLIGLVLMSTKLQERFARTTSRVSDAGNTLLAKISIDGLAGQFIVGLLLGVVWSPCVGPTLGAAVVLASQGAHTLQVAAMMALFGLGAAAPVVVLGMLSKRILGSTRGKLLMAGRAGKVAMGASMVLVSMLIISGYDKQLESSIVEFSPSWLTAITTKF